MKTSVTPIPTTGQVLRFLVQCFGTGIDKGVCRPNGMGHWARYKQIERLAKEYSQSRPVSRDLENALIDAVATVFDPSFEVVAVTANLRKVNFGKRIQSALSPPQGKAEQRFTTRLVFWVVYFIEHHEWLRPQLAGAHSPDKVLRVWVDHVTHFYTNTLADTFGANPRLFNGLPNNLTWNLPARQPDGTVKWPMCRAIEWLANSLRPGDRTQLRFILYPNLPESYSTKCFNRLVRATHLPSLSNINRWAEYTWQFTDPSMAISPGKLRVALLWCRALQFSLKAVEKRFGLAAVWELVNWHNRAVVSRQIKLAAPHP